MLSFILGLRRKWLTVNDLGDRGARRRNSLTVKHLRKRFTQASHANTNAPLEPFALNATKRRRIVQKQKSNCFCDSLDF